MAKKFAGKIGFVVNEETSPGIWTNKTEEKPYYGDLLRYNRKWDPSPDKINDDISLNNEISIVADRYAFDHYQYIRYVVISDAKWRVTNVREEYPRLILNIGGVYNA